MYLKLLSQVGVIVVLGERNLLARYTHNPVLFSLQFICITRGVVLELVLHIWCPILNSLCLDIDIHIDWHPTVRIRLVLPEWGAF